MTTREEWVGPVGDIWATEWRRTDRAFNTLTPTLDAAILNAAPTTGRALDVGCGAGETSLALAEARPDIEVTGVDISQGLIAIARDRGAQAANLSFVHGDALTVAGKLAPLDLIVSRHGVMFFENPVAAFKALHAAAAPGARLVFSCFHEWQRNAFVSELTAALGAPPPDPKEPGPFAFSDRDFVAGVLAKSGWRDTQATEIDFGYRVGAGDNPIGDAVDFLSRVGFAGKMLRNTPLHERDALLAKLRNAIEHHASGNTIDLPAAAWIWSATA